MFRVSWGNFLRALGVAIVVFELVDAEYLGHTFHYEFLILAASCLGVSVTQWYDKGGKNGRSSQSSERSGGTKKHP